jgi:hypothetical protein
VQSVVALGDPHGLAELADRYDLSPGQAVALWAHQGVAPALAARTTLARRGGDHAAATKDLREHWSAPAPEDWAEHLAEPEPVPTTTRILQGWRQQLAASANAVAPVPGDPAHGPTPPLS